MMVMTVLFKQHPLCIMLEPYIPLWHGCCPFMNLKESVHCSVIALHLNKAQECPTSCSSCIRFIGNIWGYYRWLEGTGEAKLYCDVAFKMLQLFFISETEIDMLFHKLHSLVLDRHFYSHITQLLLVLSLERRCTTSGKVFIIGPEIPKGTERQGLFSCCWIRGPAPSHL